MRSINVYITSEYIYIIIVVLAFEGAIAAIIRPVTRPFILYLHFSLSLEKAPPSSSESSEERDKKCQSTIHKR